MYNECKFGLLKYSSYNIGDEIQSVAAMQFLPQVDYYIHREGVDHFQSDGHKVKLIMNAWWMWRPEHFPPAKDIEPLLVSMHIREAIRNKSLEKRIKEYLIQNGPVGCRDLSTLQYLQANDVPAYFSGCLTLTLRGNKEMKEKKPGEYILCIDTPEQVIEEIKRRTDRPVYDFTNMFTVSLSSTQRIELAKIILSLYHNAHCVVTSRLHAGLPCLALETPVLLLRLNNKGRGGRFEGLSSLLHECTDEELIFDKEVYDFDNPPENPEQYCELRESLIQRCQNFTGYYSPNSIARDNLEAFLSLIKMLKYDYNNIRRTLWFAEKDDLLNVLYEKQVKRVSKHDLEY